MSVAVLVHSCDKYSWTWPIFFSCLHHTWTYSIPTYFASERTSYEYDRIIPIKTGDGGWARRLRFALSIIPEDNIIYLQEDFWTTHIDHSMLDAAIQVHSAYNSDITKLATNYEFDVEQISSIGRMPIYEQRKSSAYIMSHQPVAIFRKDYLLDCVDRRIDDWGPSEFELGITEMCNEGKLETKSLCIGPIFIPNRSLIWTIEHGIRKGCLIPEARTFLERQHYETFIPAGW